MEVADDLTANFRHGDCLYGTFREPLPDDTASVTGTLDLVDQMASVTEDTGDDATVVYTMTGTVSGDAEDGASTFQASLTFGYEGVETDCQ